MKRLTIGEKLALELFCTLEEEMQSAFKESRNENNPETWREHCLGKYQGMRRAQNLLELQYHVVYEFSEKNDECIDYEDYRALKSQYGVLGRDK